MKLVKMDKSRVTDIYESLLVRYPVWCTENALTLFRANKLMFSYGEIIQKDGDIRVGVFVGTEPEAIANLVRMIPDAAFDTLVVYCTGDKTYIKERALVEYAKSLLIEATS